MNTVNEKDLRNTYIDDQGFLHIDLYEGDEGRTIAVICTESMKVYHVDNTLIFKIKDYINSTLKSLISNGDLKNDLEKFIDYDGAISVTKYKNGNLDYIYAIDVEDQSYFYAEKHSRNKDYKILRALFNSFTFI